MIISNELHVFQHPTLLITSDHVQARLFVANQNILEEQGHVSLPHENTETREGTPLAPPEYNDESRLKHFVQLLCEQATALMGPHSIEVVDLVMPSEIEHLFRSHCDQDIKNKIKRTINHDLMKEDILKVVARLFE